MIPQYSTPHMGVLRNEGTGRRIESMTETKRVIRTIHDVTIDDQVKSRLDGMLGIVVEADGAAVKVQWEDGEHSIYHRRDGFVLFTPTTGPAAE